ncbi:hemolysin family protein [Vacuolonema iberomarrocanum]|uniref:hemolysin family protein n=1 Tax=Vacuolonema iberomarrocanum TaxID=3454632 RepID=UPI0019E35615|nr:HlyC/CorC family transporter [filamentous cyanobacterium LEGE 07170]
MIALAQAEPPGDALVLSQADIFIRLLSVLLLIAINAFFVTAEFSIVSVRQSRINQLAAAGDVQAQTVQGLQRSIERMLSTAQLGITLSSLALGWIGEKTMAVLVSQATEGFLSHSIAIPISFLLVAYLQIVLGELCPKSLALTYSEQLARFLGPPSLAISRFFNPFIWVLNQSTRWLLGLFKIRSSGQLWYSRVTPEELQLIIQTSSASPELEEDERELLSNVLEFADVTVRDVMVPRISIVAIERTATLRELLMLVDDSGFSRYPVIEESLDEVIGTIYFKDLLGSLVNGTITLDDAIAPWIQPPQFVPENLLLGELLNSMRQARQTLMMVADEFGGTAGLVTLEDLTERIIGDPEEVPDSEEESPIQVLDDQTVLVQAQMNLEEVNEALNLNLPVTEDYQTLGGFLIHQMEKIPSQGECLNYRNLELIVSSVDGPRLHQIRIHRLLSSTDMADADAAAIAQPFDPTSQSPSNSAENTPNSST